MGLPERFKRARRGDGLVTDIVDPTLEYKTEAVLGLSQNKILPHLRCRSSGHTTMEIDDFVHPGLRQEKMHAAESRNTTHHRIDNGLDEGARERRIHRVAAGPKHVGAGFHGIRLQAHDH